MAGDLAKKAKKKKVNRADRKTTVLIAKEIPGNRGDDDILKLLSFIENNDRKSGNSSLGGASSSVEKNKRSSAGHKKESLTASKLKKSNSMEELKSNSKMEDEAKLKTSESPDKAAAAAKPSLPEVALTLRTKVNVRKKHVTVTAALPPTQVANKDVGHAGAVSDPKAAHPHPKRGERRSWGTEELTYLGDSKSVPAQATTIGTGSDEAIRKTTKDDSVKSDTVVVHGSSSQRSAKAELNRNASSSTTAVTSAAAATPAPISSAELSLKPIGSSISDLVSASSEAAEFHVVTKKKKPKKRSVIDDSRACKSSNVFGSNSGYDRRLTCHSDTRPYSKYGPSTAYQSSHDRDAMSIFNNQHGPSNFYHIQQQHCPPIAGTSGKITTETCHKKHKDPQKGHSRRKSTSSVPPSEKSDSSDLDSVHSLPIESKLRYNNACGFAAIAAADSPSIDDKSPNNSDSLSQSNNSQASPPAQISYADIARTANVEKPSVSGASAGIQAQHSTIGLDKWPSVSKSIASEVLQSHNISFTADISSSSSNSNTSPDSSKITRPLCFAGEKPPTSELTSTMPPVTFSQMLAQQDYKVVSDNANTISANALDSESVSTDPVKPKNAPPKSRHVYEQYPELSKTVKSSKHSMHQSESVDQANSACKISPTSSDPMDVKKATKNTSPNATISSASAAMGTLECLPIKIGHISSAETIRTPATASKKNNKKDKTISARPAVIIMDNHRPNLDPSQISFRPSTVSPNALTSAAPADAGTVTPHSSPLRFGDFNDDVLRLLDQDCDLLEPIHYVIDSPAQSPPVECCSCAGVHTMSNRQPPRTHLLDLPRSDNAPIAVEFLDTSLALSDPDVSLEQLTSATLPKNGRLDLEPQVSSKPKVTASMEKAKPTASVISKSSAAASVPSTTRVAPSGTSDYVFAALEAIAQQNKSAVNTVANAKEVLAELTVRYVAPPPASMQTLANYNHDKIVNFVGLGRCWNYR